MSHVYCRGCGNQMALSAAACMGCGAPQPKGLAVEHAAPAGGQTDAVWARRFALIDKAGGPKLPKLRSLPFKDILAIKFNLWAFLFGPIYYAMKGMWKKGLALFGLVFLIVGVGELLLESVGISPSLLLFVGPAIFPGQANVSYYRRVNEGYKGWW